MRGEQERKSGSATKVEKSGVGGYGREENGGF